MRRCNVSMVIPAYNEENTIEEVVREGFAVLKEISNRYEILVCNDGSQDRTGVILDQLCKEYPELRVVHQHPNRGVAPSCWALYRMASNDWIAFFPGDGQVRPRELSQLLDGLGHFDVVVGHRRFRQDPLRRLISASVWNATSRVLFGIDVYDIDSVKLYPAGLIRQITVESLSPFMETEILVKAGQLGLRIGNVDVKHQPRLHGKASGLRAATILSAVREMCIYWWKYHGVRASAPGAPARPGDRADR